MKFALNLPSTVAQEGGGYTFQHDILHAWLKTKSKHEMSFCTSGKFTRSSYDISDIEHISLHTPFAHRLLKKVVTEATRMFKTVGGVSSTPPPSVTSLLAARRLRRAGVRFTWYLSQWDTPVQDIPYAFTLWDLQHRIQPFFPEVSEGSQWEIRERHFRRALSRASFVITGTSRGKREIEHFYGIDAARIRVLALPTPTFALDRGTDAEDDLVLRALDLPPLYLFYPAQFWSHKNHLVLLYSLRLLREMWSSPISLVLVGSDHGNQRHVEFEASRLGVRELVHFLGFVSQKQLKALYRNALALVFPSYFGPDNLPPLEAFALGCPVIAADVPGSEEQLGDAAIRVSPSSEHGFAEAALRLLQDPSLRQELIGRGTLRASAFTASDYVLAMSQIIDEFSDITRCWP